MVEPEEATQEVTEDILREAVEQGGEDLPQEKIKDGKDMKVGTDSRVQEPDPERTIMSRSMKMTTGQIMVNVITDHMGSTMARTSLTITDQIDLTDLIDLGEGKDLGAQVGIETMQEMRAKDKKEAEEETDRREDIVPGKEERGDSTLVLDEVNAQRPLVMLGLL